MSQKIFVVLTSVEKYPNLNRATGLWLGEAVHFVKKLEEAGYQVDFVSPKGGYTPIDHTVWRWRIPLIGSGIRRKNL
jgi:putative intracellular protease/amidase